MRVRVKLYGTLRRFSLPDTPGIWDGELPDGARLTDLVARLGATPSELAGAMINGALVPLETAIPDGAEVHLVSPMEGGGPSDPARDTSEGGMLATKYKSPLHETVLTTATDYWNDSCSIQELTYALDHGAVGATTNPQIILMVLKKEMALWKDRIPAIIRENPTWSEEQITWKLIEEMAVRGAELLRPIYERESGRKGRLSIQTNPALYRNATAMVDQAEHFDTLAPNMQVKLPVAAAGVQAIEEATRRGVSINATVCFTVPQAIAVAEAVERGLNRRQAAGQSVLQMSPVCTLMIGRLDDWIQVVAKRDGILADPGVFCWPGIAVFKKAYAIFQERGYRARLLAAAYRHHLHWSELIGGDVVLTIPYEWQLLFNASDIEVKSRIQTPVPPEIIEALYTKFADFRRAYDVDGMAPDEFVSYGATVRTLHGFISAYHELVGLIREFMLPNPDGR